MIKPKKSLGQNFLIDQNIIDKIISNTNVQNQNIVEIGPGTGNLTLNILKQKPKSLILIEKDKNLSSLLREKIGKNKIIQIFNSDILKFDIEKKIKKNSIIVGNLPYNISTQILVNLIKFNQWPPKFNKLILMFQKEVAEKITAKHNTKNYGRLTIVSKWRLKVINEINVSKNCFFPKPKVDSKVLVFKPILRSDYNILNINNLEKITQILFSAKRKMINKGFKKIFNDIESSSKKLNLNLSSRPSELKEDDYFKIVSLFEKKTN